MRGLWTQSAQDINRFPPYFHQIPPVESPGAAMFAWRRLGDLRELKNDGHRSGGIMISGALDQAVRDETRPPLTRDRRVDFMISSSSTKFSIFWWSVGMVIPWSTVLGLRLRICTPTILCMMIGSFTWGLFKHVQTMYVSFQIPYRFILCQSYLW